MYFQIHKLKYTNRPESKLCYSNIKYHQKHTSVTSKLFHYIQKLI